MGKRRGPPLRKQYRLNDIAAKLSDELDIARDATQPYVRFMFRILADMLADLEVGGRIYIHGFGSFELRKRRGNTFAIKNYKTQKDQLMEPGARYICFSPARTLKNQVKEREQQNARGDSVV